VCLERLSKELWTNGETSERSISEGQTNTSGVSPQSQISSIGSSTPLRTCIRVVEKSTMYLRCRFFYNSDTLSTKPTNSYVGPYNVSTLSIFRQRRYVVDVWNLYATCTQLVGKLVKFCTNLHTLNFLAFK